MKQNRDCRICLHFGVKLGQYALAYPAALEIEKTITQADGLVSNTVLTIFEDSRGRMWFGTSNGVTRMTERISKPSQQKTD